MRKKSKSKSGPKKKLARTGPIFCRVGPPKSGPKKKWAQKKWAPKKWAQKKWAPKKWAQKKSGPKKKWAQKKNWPGPTFDLDFFRATLQAS